MAFLLSASVLVLLRKHQYIDLTDYQILICALLAEAVSAIYSVVLILHRIFNSK